MGEHDNFEDRLRAMADQISRSVERLSEVDLDELAERYGMDVERARSFADAAGQWLSERLAGNDPLFGQGPPGRPEAGSPRETGRPAGAGPSDRGPDAGTPPSRGGTRPVSPAHLGPHPLDLPTGRQGVALSALDSGRWTVRPGSNQLSGTGDGPPPPAETPDLVSELRARDWITADGTVTLVGRHALARWCRTAEEPAAPAPEPRAPARPIAPPPPVPPADEVDAPGE